MVAHTNDDQLEPWPGYAAQSEADRLVTLEHKLGEARRRGDLLYAKAVSVAVAATEALARADGDRTDLERAALNHARKADEFGESLFGDVGGWTPK